MSISLLKSETFHYFLWTLAKKLTKIFFVTNTFSAYSVIWMSLMSSSVCLVILSFYKLFTTRLFQILTLNVFIIKSHVETHPLATILGRKFLFVEIFPEFWTPSHSFQIFLIFFTYLFTWSLCLFRASWAPHFCLF